MSSPAHSPLIPKDASHRNPLQKNCLSAGDNPSLTISPSFSSASSIDSPPFDDQSRILIPSKTPSSSRIPFSWEKFPGIPKRQVSKKIQDPSLNHLPLPPSTGTPMLLKKLNPNRSFRKDPFFTALVECSKDDGDDKGGNFWKGSAKITRSLSDRFGFVSTYASCKKSSSVSDSIIYIPKPRKHYLFNGPPVKFE